MATRQTHHRLSAEAGIHPRAAAVSSILPGRTVDPAPALLDSGSGAGMTDAGAAVNSVLPVAQSTPRPPSWIPARGPE